MKVFFTSYQKLNYLRGRLGKHEGASLATDCCTVVELEQRLRALCLSPFTVISEFGAQHLMRHAVECVMGEDSPYYPACLTHGFCLYMLSLFRQLAVKSASFEVCKKAGLEQIGRVLALYQRLSQGMDRQEVTRNFLSLLEKLPAEVLPFKKLEVVSSGALGESRLKLFDILKGKGVEVCFELAVPKRQDYKNVLKTYGHFAPRTLTSHPVYEIYSVLFESGNPKVLSSGLVSLRPENIELLKAGGPYREIEQAMRKIRAIMLESKTPVDPFSIALVLPELANVYQYVEDIAARYKIPVYIRRGTPVLDTPFANAVLYLFRLIKDGFKTADMQEIFSNVYLSSLWFEDEAQKNVQILEMDAFVAQNRVFAGLENWEGFTAPGFEKLKQVIARAGLCSTLAGFTEFLIGFIKSFLPGVDWQPRDVKAREQFLGVLDNVLMSARMLEGVDRKVDCAEFLEIIKSEMSQVHVRYYSGQGTGVQVMETSEIAGCCFDYVFILNVNDRTLPRVYAADPVLDSRQRKILGLELSGVRKEAEVMAFFAAVAACRKKLVLSWQDSSFSGDEKIPSYLIEDVMSLFDFGPVSSYGPEKAVKAFDECMIRDEFLFNAVCFETPVEQALKSLSFVSNREVFDLIEHKNKNLERLQKSGGDFYSRELEADISTRCRHGTFRLSPSAAASLVACPLLWYLRYYLGVERVFEPDRSGPEPMLLGSAVHLCLERLFTLYPDSKVVENITPDIIRAELLRAWDETKVIPGGDNPQRYHYVFEQDVLNISRYVAALTKGQEDFNVLMLEKSFGTKGAPYAGFAVKDPQAKRGSVLLCGRLDRCDAVRRDGIEQIQVVDYKRGKLDTEKKRAAMIQLSVYSLLVSHVYCAVENKNAQDVDACVVGLGEEKNMVVGLEKLLGKQLSLKDWLCLGAGTADMDEDSSFVRLLWKHVGNLVDGKLVAGEGLGCGRCDFSLICPKHRMGPQKGGNV